MHLWCIPYNTFCIILQGWLGSWSLWLRTGTTSPKRTRHSCATYQSNQSHRSSLLHAGHAFCLPSRDELSEAFTARMC